jgi:N6-L-threonylcarbamoyladenine synthase
METKKDIIILGIESSCDDTSSAVIKNGYLLSNIIANQNVHKAYGGVVPELASRAHSKYHSGCRSSHPAGKYFAR